PTPPSASPEASTAARQGAGRKARSPATGLSSVQVHPLVAMAFFGRETRETLPRAVLGISETMFIDSQVQYVGRLRRTRSATSLASLSGTIYRASASPTSGCATAAAAHSKTPGTVATLASISAK